MSNTNLNTNISNNNFIDQINAHERNRLVDQQYYDRLSQPYIIRAGYYGRVSSRPQAAEDKVSLTEQKNDCDKLIEDKKMETIDIYEDKGNSGENMKNRPAFQNLIADAKAGKFDVIVAWSTDRLARNVEEMTQLRSELKKYNIQITTVKEPTEIIDPRRFNPKSSGTNQLVNYLNDWKAEQDNVARVNRFQMGKLGKAKRGNIPVKVPYGYKKIVIFENGDPKKKKETDKIVEHAAYAVREIFDSYDKKSWGIRKIAEHLNSKSIPSPRGKQWCYSTVKYTLQNPTYAGLVRYGWRLSQSKASRTRLQQGHEGIITKGNHLLIISIEQFKRVQEKIAIRKKLGGKAVSSRGLLTGILKCGRCGGGTYLGSWSNWLAYKKEKSLRDRHKKVVVYLCSTYSHYGRSGCTQRYVISAQKIEKLVLEQINKLSNSETTRKEYINQMQKNDKKLREEKLTQLKASLDKVGQKLSRLRYAYTNAGITYEEFISDKNIFEQEKNDTLSQIEITTSELNQEEKLQKQSSITINALNNFQNSWEIAEFHEKKALLHSLLDKIIIKDDAIQILFNKDRNRHELSV